MSELYQALVKGKFLNNSCFFKLIFVSFRGLLFCLERQKKVTTIADFFFLGLELFQFSEGMQIKVRLLSGAHY